MAISDEDIIRLMFERDEQALTEAQGKFNRYLKVISKNITGSEEDAEECVNDAFLKTWESIPPNRPSDLKAYLGKITRNLSLNRYLENHAEKRGGQAFSSVFEELEEFIPDRNDVEEDYLRQELTSEINAFLGTLPLEKRQLFVRRYYFADSIPEIARRFGISENAASVRLNRLREKLKKHLTERGYHP